MSPKAHVLFNTHGSDWFRCMEKCPMYNRALAPSFTSEEEMAELRMWAYNTTTDPISKTHYEDSFGRSIWIPFR